MAAVVEERSQQSQKPLNLVHTMSTTPQLPSAYARKKPFYKRPDGIIGAVLLVGLLALVGWLLVAVPWGLILTKAVYVAALAALVVGLSYVILDPRMRQMVSYAYQGFTRKLAGTFVQMDPIGILKSYIGDLEKNLKSMNAQINKLRGQMHKLDELIQTNAREIDSNMRIAKQAKAREKTEVFTLKTRRAARLKDSNIRLSDLYKKMEVLYRVLDRMYRNGEILIEDVRDQVDIKERERAAIQASHGAMQSAARVMGEDKDARYLYDQALEAIAEDVSAKVGEMERFMEMSSTFMDSVDLQNGVLEERGLEMLERWEREGESMILGEGQKSALIAQANDEADVLHPDESSGAGRGKDASSSLEPRTNQFDRFFDERRAKS